jgi:hypothetical protein
VYPMRLEAQHRINLTIVDDASWFPAPRVNTAMDTYLIVRLDLNLVVESGGRHGTDFDQPRSRRAWWRWRR